MQIGVFSLDQNITFHSNLFYFFYLCFTGTDAHVQQCGFLTSILQKTKSSPKLEKRKKKLFLVWSNGQASGSVGQSSSGRLHQSTPFCLPTYVLFFCKFHLTAVLTARVESNQRPGIQSGNLLAITSNAIIVIVIIIILMCASYFVWFYVREIAACLD